LPEPRVLPPARTQSTPPYTGVDPAQSEVMGWWRDAERLVVRQEVREALFIPASFELIG